MTTQEIPSDTPASKDPVLSSEVCLITVADMCSFSDKYNHNDTNICNAQAHFFLSQKSLSSKTVAWSVLS